MLEFTILRPEGIVVLKPNASLSKEDFVGLSASVSMPTLQTTPAFMEC